MFQVSSNESFLLLGKRSRIVSAFELLRHDTIARLVD